MQRICRVRSAALSVLTGPLTMGPLIIGALMATAPAAADTSTSYHTYADVVAVAPQYRWRDVVEPVRRCEAVPVSRYPSSTTYRQVGAYRYSGARDYDQPYYRHDRDRGLGAGLLGGLIGGLVGNQFGGGSGKAVLTVAGAALGASIATDHVREHRRTAHDAYYRPLPSAAGPWDRAVVQRCTESEQTRLVREVAGYDVTYRYHGHTFRKWAEQHPGERIRIQVDVEPDGNS